MADNAEELDVQLKKLQYKLRQERARSQKAEFVRALNYLSHDDLVDLYNALVVKLASI